MTPELVGELQQRIDRALWRYRDHVDYEDLRQAAWLRLLQAGRLHPEADLRAWAAKTARWEAIGYWKEGRGLHADHEALTKAGYEVMEAARLPGFLEPVTPDFAPLLIRRMAWKAAVPWRKLAPVDRQILWQVGARGTAMRTVAARIGRHYSFVHARYHRALRLCRAVAEREARAVRQQERAH